MSHEMSSEAGTSNLLPFVPKRLGDRVIVLFSASAWAKYAGMIGTVIDVRPGQTRFGNQVDVRLDDGTTVGGYDAWFRLYANPSNSLENPAHYKKGNLESIDYIEAVTADVPGDEAVSVANVLKYVSRYRQKHPLTPSRDLRKAAWYLDRLIKLVEGKGK